MLLMPMFCLTLQAFSNLLRVKKLVSIHDTKVQDEKTTDFLYAASKGDAIKVHDVGG
jgi:hypothetical protein